MHSAITNDGIIRRKIMRLPFNGVDFGNVASRIAKLDDDRGKTPIDEPNQVVREHYYADQIQIVLTRNRAGNAADGVAGNSEGGGGGERCGNDQQVEPEEQPLWPSAARSWSASRHP